MVDLLHDSKCQDTMTYLTKVIHKKKFIYQTIAILSVFVSSIMIIYAWAYYFQCEFAMGVIGFIIVIILMIGVYSLYIFLLFLQIQKEIKIVDDMYNNECDPLRALYICDSLVQHKVFEEGVIAENILSYLLALEHLDRIRYLLNKYPKVGIYSNLRIVAEFLILDSHQQDLQREAYYQKNKAFFEKLRQTKPHILQQKPSATRKHHLKIIERGFDAQHLFYQGQYDEAIALFKTCHGVSNAHDIDVAYFLAHSYLRLGDKKAASEQFMYIIEHGNTMKYVDYAKQLYDKINETV